MNPNKNIQRKRRAKVRMRKYWRKMMPKIFNRLKPNLSELRFDNPSAKLPATIMMELGILKPVRVIERKLFDDMLIFGRCAHNESGEYVDVTKLPLYISALRLLAPIINQQQQLDNILSDINRLKK